MVYSVELGGHYGVVVISITGMVAVRERVAESEIEPDALGFLEDSFEPNWNQPPFSSMDTPETRSRDTQERTFCKW